MSMCACCSTGNPPESPSLCVFAAKPISRRLCVVKCCFPSVIILHLDADYLRLIAEGMDLALLRPQWQWHMLTLHKYIITLFLTSHHQLSALADAGFDDSSQRGVPIGGRR